MASDKVHSCRQGQVWDHQELIIPSLTQLSHKTGETKTTLGLIYDNHAVYTTYTIYTTSSHSKLGFKIKGVDCPGRP